MIQHEDGSLTLEGSERVNIQREIDWVIQDWLDGDRYDSALVFPPAQPTHSGYTMMPIRVDPQTQ